MRWASSVAFDSGGIPKVLEHVRFIKAVFEWQGSGSLWWSFFWEVRGARGVFMGEGDWHGMGGLNYSANLVFEQRG